MSSESQAHRAIIYALLGVGIIARLIPHPWNATPVMAIALFGGAHLSKRLSLLVPFLIIAISDFIIGWHATIPFTWSALLLTSVIGWWVRRRASGTRIVTGALAGAALFFVLSNFGVWITQQLYPRTAAGLWECYVAAIPFFRATVLGDLVFTTVLFGGYALATRACDALSTSR